MLALAPGIKYDRRWLFWRGRIIHEGFELVNGISEIVLVETFKKQKKNEACNQIELVKKMRNYI